MMMGNIKEWLNDRGSLVLQGDLFQMRCSNQIAHLIAQKGLEVAAGSIEKIRECVKYIWSSQSRKEKFESALMQLQLAGRSVHLDVDMTWVSTYSMLKSATDLRQGFVRLAKLDSDFKCLPNSDEWEQGIMICQCLKVLYDMTAKLKPERYSTTTMYFNIYEVNKNIRTWESSTHKYIREMVLEMRGHFDRYWSTCSLLMSVAVVLDPRYKMNLVKFVFHRLYGEHLSKTYISDFRQALNNLFSSYESQSSSSSPNYFGNSFTGGSGSANLENNKVTSQLDLDYYEFLMEESNNVVQKTELEKYLEDPLFPKGADESKFDVLGWWKKNGRMYPKLAKMARDVLAVPMSTVSSQYAFGGGDRVLTGHRIFNGPEVVQALSCLKSWLP
ncbi:zinc finger BED domain-containing protein RICESLEEPER 1-like [Papaver somniferum]|uniref:zinc finger BED domain-containing protein RICESLEEPER 1-like n=1 Tax=Papaver somniferum TaxID=3469 RepID=UPI000E6F6B03|nr:zinc finger BED domain-containing protein RICESLEEPER 1-like [Papaver somniferum]XP_026390139.1 zinc finger BED domain-containing protein RICESLEEPER 1-like [Papaver somniferum]XP_026390140.1 zinc finger BED domain-containing protein RICESLEEPER 1-like [Papaver somniferum]